MNAPRIRARMLAYALFLGPKTACDACDETLYMYIVYVYLYMCNTDNKGVCAGGNTHQYTLYIRVPLPTNYKHSPVYVFGVFGVFVLI